MTCRTCKFLEVSPNAAGRIIPRKHNVYRCLAPEPELPPLPKSLTDYYGFTWPPRRKMMTPDYGEGCPVYSVRQKERKP